MNCEEYFPYFQPIVDLSTGKISGYEALARTTKDGKVVSAGNIFADKQEDLNDLLAVDRHIRKQALVNHHTKDDGGFITINISPEWINNLQESDVTPTLEIIAASGIEPSRVIIEITEFEGDMDKLRHFAKLYQTVGLRVAVDDFGAGASQLDRVAELEPDLIKLDMGLLKEAATGGIKADVALSISALAKRAGCKIICEGVETEEEFHFAIECGADYIQGWIFYPALAEHIDSNSTVNLTKNLKRSYLKRKQARVMQAIEHNRLVFESVAGLSDALKQGNEVTAEKCSQMHKMGVMRYYLCNRYSDQVSPNCEISPNGITEDYSEMHSNWCHRPYFPLFSGLHSSINKDLLVSEPYKDKCSGGMCKTYTSFLNENTMLMIDVLVEDTILFVSK